jgi:hypothetical protein
MTGAGRARVRPHGVARVPHLRPPVDPWAATDPLLVSAWQTHFARPAVSTARFVPAAPTRPARRFLTLTLSLIPARRRHRPATAAANTPRGCAYRPAANPDVPEGH